MYRLSILVDMDEYIQEDDILLFYCDISYSMILYSDLKSFEEHSLLISILIQELMKYLLF